jgi:tetratricopeptide (TPR) repeat protein
MRIVLATALLLAVAYVPVDANFDLANERDKLWQWMADKHTEVGDEYKKAKIHTQARREYDRARELEPDNRKAWAGLGYRKRGSDWVPDTLLPDNDEVHGAEFLEARKKPDAKRTENYEKNADRARKLMQKADKAGDARAARIIAGDVLFYAPDDAEARKLKGHVNKHDAWQPEITAKWRDEGLKILGDAGFGDELEGEDEQAKLIEQTFNRRKSEFLITRTSHDSTRAKMLHRAGLATITRTLELLGSEGPPFGRHVYTITQLRTRTEHEAMLTNVLKLEGDKLDFAKRLSGHGQGAPYGYFCWSVSDTSADDMLCNTISLRVLAHAQTAAGDRAPWETTGFGYLVTSQVLGTTMTQRYSMKKVGETASDHEVMPEFTKKAGSPELLREVALYNIDFKRDVPLRQLIATEINDMQQAHAAKSFSFMEFVFAEHQDAARKWLRAGGPAKPEARAKLLEDTFGKTVEELENAWREWVWANY